MIIFINVGVIVFYPENANPDYFFELFFNQVVKGPITFDPLIRVKGPITFDPLIRQPI